MHLPVTDEAGFENDAGVPIVEFDFASLEDIFSFASYRQESEAKMAEALSKMLCWLAQSESHSKERRLQATALRAFAAAWVISPGFFDGKSLTALATDLGVSKQSMSLYAKEFSEHFNIPCRGLRNQTTENNHEYE